MRRGLTGIMAPLLQAIGIGKTYPGGVVANDGVNLTVEAGEVHAVVGENGAGKSTLMKILFGIEQADRGELRLAGETVRFANPRAAIDAGIGMVFQHFSLVPSFSVYENVVLGSEPRSGIRFDRRQGDRAGAGAFRSASGCMSIRCRRSASCRSASSSGSRSSRRSTAMRAS